MLKLSCGKTLRPFSERAKVKCRSYSSCLQKVLVDFGADVSFQEAQKKVKEHYNLEISKSSLQAIVKTHAKHISEFIEKDKDKLKIGNAKQLIVQMDGSMVPITETFLGKDSKDSRRSKSTKWREARLCFAREENSASPFFMLLSEMSKERVIYCIEPLLEQV